MLSATLSSAALLTLAHSVVAVPSFEKIQHAEVTLDLEQSATVPVPGGSQLGIPVSNVEVTSDSLFNGTCTGYSWTTTYDAGSEAEYVDVEVQLNCVTSDDVPFTVLEVGSGKKSATTLRRVTYSIGAPYEHLRSEYLIAEVVTPVPNLSVDIYRYVQNTE